MEYPKIETLYERDKDTFKVNGILRLPEFGLVLRWLVTEKIDGMNIRVQLHGDGTVTYGGRTDAAQLYAPLVTWLHTHLSSATVAPIFDPSTEAILFGEGYGPKIQKGGNYRTDVSFRLFDVAVLTPVRVWWLNWADVRGIAEKCGVQTVPEIASGVSLGEALALVKSLSQVAATEGQSPITHEGIVCRTDPLLLTRSGQRLMWKLKVKDF